MHEVKCYHLQPVAKRSAAVWLQGSASAARCFRIESSKLIFGVQDDSPIFALFLDVPRRDDWRNHTHLLAASPRYDNLPSPCGHCRIDILLSAPPACCTPPKGIYRLRGSLSGSSHVVLSPGRTSLTSPDIHQSRYLEYAGHRAGSHPAIYVCIEPHLGRV